MGQRSRRVSTSDLEAVGLTKSERVAYEALLTLGASTPAELREVLPRGTAPLSRVLNDLERKGLVSRTKARSRPRFEAVPPEVGLESFFLRREEEIRRARLAARDLETRFDELRAKRDEAGLTEVVAGEGAVKQRYVAVHRSARESLRVMSRPPYVMTLEETKVISAEAHERRVRARNIIDARYLELDPEGGRLSAARDDVTHGEQYRALARVPLKLVVADDRYAVIPLVVDSGGIRSAILLRASALLSALIEVFDTFWELATPLDVLAGSEHEESRAADSASEEERELLALLATGVSDEAIARQLGVSSSTAQRRIHALKARLGVTSRFQAGIQAARRGWV